MKTKKQNKVWTAVWVAASFAFVGPVAARAESPKADTAFDRFIEQMTQRVAFHEDVEDGQKALMEQYGYTTGDRIKGTSGMSFRVFKSTKEGSPAIVAFRGTTTTSVAAMFADLDPVAVGKKLFARNRSLIGRTIKEAGGGGRVVLAGFSLGGALAQRAAIEYPNLTLRVVTYHTPGIDKAEVKKLDAYNRANPASAVRSDHYVIDGDIVSEAGEAFTGGVIHEYKIKGATVLDLADRHGAYILADVAQADGVKMPVRDKNLEVVFVKDRPSSSKKFTAIEVLRTTAALAVTPTKAVVSGVKKTIDAAGEAADDASDAVKKAGRKAKKAVKSVKKIFQ
jgi:dienelactone hydrolase